MGSGSPKSDQACTYCETWFNSVTALVQREIMPPAHPPIEFSVLMANEAFTSFFGSNKANFETPPVRWPQRQLRLHLATRCPRAKRGVNARQDQNLLRPAGAGDARRSLRRIGSRSPQDGLARQQIVRRCFGHDAAGEQSRARRRRGPQARRQHPHRPERPRPSGARRGDHPDLAELDRRHPGAKKSELSTTIIQQAGSILLEVEKRNVKHFQVETPYLAAVVKGTQFRVTVGQGETPGSTCSGARSR